MFDWDGDLSAYEQDWRRREHGKALAVVRPGSTEEVAAVVKACAATGTLSCRAAATPVGRSTLIHPARKGRTWAA